MDNLVGPLILRIGGEATGEVCEDVLDEVDQMVVVEVEAVVVTGVHKGAVLDRMILWPVIAVGCVAIWPVTVPKQHNHKGVVMLCPPVEIFQNLGKKALEGEVVDGQFASVA